MYLRTKILNRRIVFYWRKITTVEGVNSDTLDGYHIPLLDTDDCTLLDLVVEMRRLQKMFNLGDVSICNTGRENSFHVYVWNKMTWRECVAVVANCRYIDMKHLHFSIRRGHFTLRISPKTGRKITEIYRIESSNPTTASYKDFKSFVTYETASKLGDVKNGQ